MNAKDSKAVKLLQDIYKMTKESNERANQKALGITNPSPSPDPDETCFRVQHLVYGFLLGIGELPEQAKS